jgi:hypothetical protein
MGSKKIWTVKVFYVFNLGYVKGELSGAAVLAVCVEDDLGSAVKVN